MEESLQDLIHEKKQILVELEELRYIVDNLEDSLIDVQEEIDEILSKSNLEVLK